MPQSFRQSGTIGVVQTVWYPVHWRLLAASITILTIFSVMSECVLVEMEKTCFIKVLFGYCFSFA